MKYDRNLDNKALMWAKKIKGINLLGSKCSKCGDSNIFVLQFHHTRGKDFSMSAIKNSRWSTIKKELEKCVLLCGNCHYELHCVESRGSKLKREIIKNLLINPKCSRCGYHGDNLHSLCFHHKDKSNKLFNVSWALARKIRSCSVQDIIDEIQKCDILCENCHVIEHINKEEFSKMKDIIYDKVNNYKENNCLDVGLIQKMKLEGRGLCEIAKTMGINKSSVFYVFHKVDKDGLQI